MYKKRRVTKKFQQVSRCSRAKQVQRNVQMCCACKVAFSLIRPIVVFHRSPALPSPLSITRFYILFEQTLNIIESYALSPGNVYIKIHVYLFKISQISAIFGGDFATTAYI